MSDTRWSAHSKDNFFAPGLSEFTAAEIHDLADEPHANAWLVNFILNSMLRGRAQSPGHEFRFNLHRRTVNAFADHQFARGETYAFLANPEEAFVRYFAAVNGWERFLGSCWQAYNTLRELGGRVALFEKDDGSLVQRVNALYNQMKHTESRIANGQMPDTGPLPVWLTNDGLRSTDTTLGWAETGDVLRDLAKYAELFVDPVTTAEKIEAMQTEPDQDDGT